ncbi:unnamed protein product [Ambrosiozyma monospora]|uniref:Unnamed protein product n=1 Tax=Ambrosiozyma monospora TaxID=43982 RepID=A0ACB5SZU3_AMBMO|nr:unnamed protein product [Ambrosiozyma monospora]
MMSEKPIVIVGAGVIGLTCAHHLALKGYKNVRIVAKEYPTTDAYSKNYASSGVFTHHKLNQLDQSLHELSEKTYHHFKALSKYSDTSISFIDCMDSFPIDANYTVSTELDDSKFLVSISESSSEINIGYNYPTWTLNPRTYVSWLEHQLKDVYKIKCDKLELKSLKQVEELYNPKTIVNCTGMGLQYDGSWDPTCFSTKEVSLLIKPSKLCILEPDNVLNIHLKDNTVCYRATRGSENDVVIGITSDILSCSNNQLSARETISLFNVAFPELLIDDWFDIKRFNVKMKHLRKGGIKIGRQVKECSLSIIDCYGFGNHDFELSWGASCEVMKLISDSKSKL